MAGLRKLQLYTGRHVCTHVDTQDVYTDVGTHVRTGSEAANAARLAACTRD